MTDAQFNTKIKSELLDDILNGRIDLSLYPRILYHLIELSNNGLLGCTIVALTEKFRHGIDIITKQGEYNGEVDNNIDLFNSADKIPDEYNQIKEYTENANAILLKRQNSKKASELFSILKNDADEFCRIINNMEAGYPYIPIFSDMKINEIYEILASLSTSKIVKVRNTLSNRYDFFNQRLASDYHELGKLGAYILEKHPKTNEQSLTNHLLRVLAETLVAKSKLIPPAATE